MRHQSILVLSALLSSVAMAKQNPDSSEAFLKSCSVMTSGCELRLFQEIAKTYRPSKEEGELREYILNVARTSATKMWKRPLVVYQDKIGNLMIRLPATGDFAKAKGTKKHFALQSHMDMVLAYADAKPGEDVKPYFKDGVELEVKDGWIQSRDLKTSIGADNGIGVATALKYLISPQVAHPPLELIFTVQEEVGLVGAFNSELPILSKKMLCLDGMTPEVGFVIAGAQGANANLLEFSGNSAQEKNSGENVVIQVTVTKLAGGHSGGDIHKGHLNAMKAFASLTKYVSSIVGEVGVKTVVVGDVGVFNKIPNLFQAELVIAKSKVSKDLTAQIENYLKNLIVQNADDAAAGAVQVAIKSDVAAKFFSTEFNLTNSVIEGILNSPNGLLIKNSQFVNSVQASNNLSFFKLEAQEASKVSAQLGWMARGFFAEDMNAANDQVRSSMSPLASSGALTVANKMDIAPWFEPDSSELLQETMAISSDFGKKYFLNGGLEPSAFKKKIQDLQVVALGPLIMNAHSVNEKLKVDTVDRTTKNILKIVQNQK